MHEELTDSNTLTRPTVSRHPEGKGVRLWEHVQSVEFLEDLLSRFPHQASAFRPGEEIPPVLLYKLFIMASTESAAQAVSLTGGKSGDINGTRLTWSWKGLCQGAFQGAFFNGVS